MSQGLDDIIEITSTGSTDDEYAGTSKYDVPDYSSAASVAAQFAAIGGETAYIATRYATAHEAYLEAEAAYKKFKALRYLSIREKTAASGSKVTEGLLEAAVDADDQVFQSRMVFVSAEGTREVWKGRLEAIRAKRDALVGLAASARVEMAAWGAERTR